MSTNDRIHHSALETKLKNIDKDCVLIDVRSKDEHLSGTIPGASCIPHDQVAENLSQIPKDKEVLLFCRSGGRSSKAKETLKNLGYTNIKDVEGGFAAWAEAGKPIQQQRKCISIQRQVMLAAGSLISISMALGYFYNPGFYVLAAFVGLGLMFAGISGFCGMALLLESMPWNKINTGSSCKLS